MTDAEINCALCDEPIRIGCVGRCDHLICFTCSTKLRVVCVNKACPICRTELDEVIFTRRLNLKFSELDKSCPGPKDSSGIRCEDEESEKAMRELNRIRCSVCSADNEFSTINLLDDHLQTVHRMQMCPICLDFLRLFPFERRIYDRNQLAKHMTEGEQDDRSFKGHPMCQYCYIRFFDKDELFRHSTNNHFFCSFCSSEGNVVFWRDYRELRKHFRFNHYLCELGECSQMQNCSNAFKTEAEYKAHVVRCHPHTKKTPREAGQISEHSLYPRSFQETEEDEETQTTEPHVSFEGLTPESFPELETGNNRPIRPAVTPTWAQRANLIRPDRNRIDMDSEFPQLVPRPTTSLLNPRWKQTQPNQQNNFNNDRSKVNRPVATNRQPVPNISTDFPALPQPSPKPLFNQQQQKQKLIQPRSKPAMAIESQKAADVAPTPPYRASLDQDFPALPVRNKPDKRKRPEPLKPRKHVEVKTEQPLQESLEEDFPALPSVINHQPLRRKAKIVESVERNAAKEMKNRKMSVVETYQASLAEDFPVLPVKPKQSSIESQKSTKQVFVVDYSKVIEPPKTSFVAATREHDFPALPVVINEPMKRKVKVASVVEPDLATRLKNQLFVSSSSISPFQREPTTPNPALTRQPIESDFPTLEGTKSIKTENAWEKEAFYEKSKIMEKQKKEQQIKIREDKWRHEHRPPPGFENVKPVHKPAPAHPYIKSKDYVHEKALLICKVKDRLNAINDDFSQFRSYYDNYLKSEIDALSFYNKCIELFQFERLLQIIWDIIAIIPHIPKQNELYTLVQAMMIPSLSGSERRNMLMKSGKGGMKGPLSKCKKCEQLVFMNELDKHEACHNF